MSEVDPKDSGAVDNAGGAGVETKEDNSGLKAAYDKAVTREKNLKNHNAELQSKLDRMEQDKLAAEGNKDELIAKLQKRVGETEDLLKKRDESFAWTAITSQIKAQASAMGCVDTDALVELAKDDLQTFDGIGEDYSVDSEKLKSFLDTQAKRRGYLFKAQQVNVQNVNPGQGAPKGKDLKDMTHDERKEVLKSVMRAK